MIPCVSTPSSAFDLNWSRNLVANFGIGTPFDRLRMIGYSSEQNTKLTPFGPRLPFDRLRTIGNSNRQNTNPTPFGLRFYGFRQHHLRHAIAILEGSKC